MEDALLQDEDGSWRDRYGNDAWARETAEGWQVTFRYSPTAVALANEDEAKGFLRGWLYSRDKLR